MPKNKQKQQVSSEFMTTYGFALIVIALVIALVFLFTSTTQNAVPTTCTFSYGTYCNDLVLASNSVGSHAVFLFTNTQQYALVNPQMTINSSSTGAATGTCEPKYVPAGSAIICNVTLNGNSISVGSQVGGQVKLIGITCPSGNANLCAGSQSQTFIGTFNTHVSALTTSNPVSITLSAQNYTQLADGTYDQLTARVMLLGYPLTGGSINFTSNKTFATPSPAVAVSNSKGDSYSFVRSTNSTGSVKITASFAGHSASVIIGFARPVYVTFATSGASGALGTILSVDGNTLSQSQLPDRFAFGQGTQHTYSFTTLISGASGTRYSFASISGCSLTASSQTFNASSSCTATASYITQYYLTMSASPSSAGSVSPSPPGIWENAGSQATISESPSAGYAFSSWSGSGTISYSGTNPSSIITLNSPISETASFTSSTTLSTSTSTSTTLSTTSSSTTVTETTTSTSSTTASTTISPYTGYLYVTGMWNSSNPYEEGAFDPVVSSGNVASTWQVRSAPPTGTEFIEYYNDGVCGSYNNYIYCLNSTGWQNVSKTYYAQLTTNGIGTWNLGSSTYPIPAIETSCAEYSGYIYCVGGGLPHNGQTLPGETYTSAVYYAPLTSSGIGTWSQTTSYPIPVGGASCQIANGYIYCLGGNSENYYPLYPYAGNVLNDKTDPSPYYTQAYYAPVSSSGVGTWISTTPYPVDVAGAQCVTSNNYLYCVGGVGSPDSTPNGTTTFYNQTYYAQILGSSGLGSWIASSKTPGHVPTTEGIAPCVAYNNFIYCDGFNGPPVNYIGLQIDYASLSSSGVGTWSPISSAWPIWWSNEIVAGNPPGPLPLLTTTSTSTSTSTTVTTTITKVTTSVSSFVGGTQVLLANGTYGYIQDLRPGEAVLSYNVKSGNFYTNTVVKVINFTVNGEYLINNLIGTDSGEVFYTSSGTWVHPNDLKVNDKILDPLTNTWINVTSVAYTPSTVKVYDIIGSSGNDFVVDGGYLADVFT